MGIKLAEDNDLIYFKDMVQGKAYIIIGSDYEDHVVMKFYGNIVGCLTDGRVWDSTKEITIKARLLNNNEILVID